MLLNKLFASAVLAISCSSAAYANFIAHDWSESEEDDEGIFQFAAEGAYYTQSNNLMTLDGFSSAERDLSLFSNMDLLFPPLGDKPEHDWGYTVYLGYIFPEHNYDVQASYTGLRSDKKVSDSGITTGLTSDTGEGPDPIPADAVNGAKYEYNFSEAELTFGRFIEVADPLTIRLGFGVAYADINQKAHDAFSDAATGDYDCGLESTCNDSAATTGFFQNSFEGVGPKVTLDGLFDLTDNFGLVGGVGVSALYGRSKVDFHYASELTECIDGGCGVEPTSRQFKDKQNKMAIGLDGKAGLRFAQAIRDDFAWNIEAGFKAETYVNALQEGPNVLDLSETTIGASQVVGLENFDDDYYNYGPYVLLGIDFM